jgi:neuropeptide Y receptor
MSESEYLPFMNASGGEWFDESGSQAGGFLMDPTNETGNRSLDNLDLDGPEPMPVYARVIITIMYSTITVVAVGGNGIVCYIVLAYQKMRTVTNFFIVNLACADLLMAVLCIPFTFIANLLVQYWPFGSIMCPVINYAQVVTVFLSAFTLVAISLDRFVAIICPLRPKMTTRQAAIVIGVIWLLSLAVPLPIAILSQTVIRDYTGKPRMHCEESWEDVNDRYIYSLVIMVLQYFLPLFVLTFTYTWIGIVIWVQKPPGEAQNTRDQRMAASKRKVREREKERIGERYRTEKRDNIIERTTGR